MKFFDSPDDGVLITDSETVTGMEADVVICFATDFRGILMDVIMRTISDFYLVVVDNPQDYEELLEAGFNPYDIPE